MNITETDSQMMRTNSSVTSGERDGGRGKIRVGD